jgi:hypothetical protein
MFKFKKATKGNRKAKIALYGPSGGGKTYTSLQIASGLGQKIALVDTEGESASLYCDDFDFDILSLETPTVNNILMVFEQISKSDYDILIIDSFSHTWHELLAEVEQIAKREFNGNIQAAWSKGTPKQNSLKKAILNFKKHLIVTMRSETEWVIEKNDSGKTVFRRVGLKPIQGKQLEFEFDVFAHITTDHELIIEKSRYKDFQDQIIAKPDKKFGESLLTWLHLNPESQPELTLEPQPGSINIRFQKYLSNKNIITKEQLINFAKEYGLSSEKPEELERLLANTDELNEMIKVFLEVQAA